jgi:hypothetical protein
MKKKSTPLRASRRAPASKRTASSRRGSPAGDDDGASTPGGVAAQILGAQRKLWNAGVTALYRGRKAASPIGTAAIAESFQGGLKKLEGVFDQRVLNSLANAGMPSPRELCELVERVEHLSAEVRRLSRTRAKG